MLRSAHRRGRLNLTAPRESTDMIRRPECEGLDRHRGLATAGGHKAAAVAQEEIPDIVSAVVAVDHGIVGVIANPERQVASTKRLYTRRLSPTPIVTVPMACATRRAEGKSRSRVIAAVSTAMARMSMTSTTRRMAVRPAQQ